MTEAHATLDAAIGIIVRGYRGDENDLHFCIEIAQAPDALRSSIKTAISHAQRSEK